MCENGGFLLSGSHTLNAIIYTFLFKQASNQGYWNTAVARATWVSSCSALEETCSVGLPLKHNLSTTDECTRVQHIYAHKVTRQQVTI